MPFTLRREVNMTKSLDDLDATRQVVAILEPFESIDRERIIRWAREKLGMIIIPPTGGGAGLNNPPPLTSTNPAAASDIKSFVESKNPKNDTQLAATVAYYYRFLAPETERKESITSGDLLEACRKADRTRPARAAQTMVNAFSAGLFDKAGHGSYNLMNDKAPAFKSAAAPKDKHGVTQPLKDWTLKNYIEVAHELGWIGKSAKDVGVVLRDYRNYIHPAKEFSHGITLSSSDTQMFWPVFVTLSKQLLVSTKSF